jgi:hypothetical protein
LVPGLDGVALFAVMDSPAIIIARVRVRARARESRSIYRVATRYRLHTHYSALWMLSAWASRDDVVGLL